MEFFSSDTIIKTEAEQKQLWLDSLHENEKYWHWIMTDQSKLLFLL